MSAKPYYIPWYARQIIPYSISCPSDHTIYQMRCPPGLPYSMTCPQCHTVYHDMHTRACHARQAIPYTTPCIARPYHKLCYASPHNTLYHVMPARPYHMLFHANQAIPYTMPCSPGYTIYNFLAIPFTMPGPPGHTFSNDMLARPYHIPCHASPGHDIYHAMPRPMTTSVNHVT